MRALENSAGTACQIVHLDLPGEAVQCWRSEQKIRVVLRKHRDVFFDINLVKGQTYSLESQSDFYSPQKKKLMKSVQFQDGERLHIWIGREFSGKLTLKNKNTILGVYDPTKLDSVKYDADPKTKPEPLMVAIGHRPNSFTVKFEATDQYSASGTQPWIKQKFDPKVADLKNFGTKFDYQCSLPEPEIQEYACITEASPSEIRPNALAKLNNGAAIEGTIDEIFLPPTGNEKKSDLYTSIVAAATTIAEHETTAVITEKAKNLFTSNYFKETAGYLQENWRQLNNLKMRVRIEKRIIGKYRVVFKGKLLIKNAATAAGVISKKMPLGSPGSAFLDGGFERSGKAGFGGFKRMVLTATENFRSGVKIQIIGTVIDLIGDINEIYLKKNGNKDLSEFLGRAGVSIAKAGTTAAIGSIFAAGIMMLLGMTTIAAGLPVAAVALLVVGGYIGAAYIVDAVDERFKIKDTVAGWAH